MAAPSQPVPIRLRHEGGQVLADWADLTGTDPALPYLHDRIIRAGAGWRAPLPAARRGSTAPTALILHAGRCGSTLVSRSLSRLARCHVVSEPQALNDVLGIDGVWPFLPALEKREVLQQVVEALSRGARPDQDRFILKLSSWNALRLPLLEAVFPNVPKLFIYRPPEEILVSLRDEPAGWMARAGHRIKAGLFLGLPSAPALDTPLAFAAQVLGGILSAVAETVARQRAMDHWLLVPYGTLPGALTAQILPWLGLQPTPEEANAIADGLAIHAKDATGQRPFVPDDADKRAAVTEELRDLIRDLICAPYQRLDELRRHASTSER